MPKIIIEKMNEVYFLLICEENIRKELYNFFEVETPGSKFMKSKDRTGWNGKISLFDSKRGLLPIGLLQQLREFASNYSYELDFSSINKEEFKNNFSKEEIDEYTKKVITKEDFEPRYYQFDSILASLNKKRGVLKIGTSGGKSAITYTLSRKFLELNKKTLIIVPNLTLIDQLYTDFKDLGWDFDKGNLSLLKAGETFNPNTDVLISTFQSLVKLDRNEMELFKSVIVDEVHLAPAKSILTALKKCINAEFKIGMTGTLPKDVYKRNIIKAFIGSTIYEIGTEKLQKENFIAKCKVINIILDYPYDDCIKLVSEIEKEDKNGKIRKKKIIDYKREVDFINNHVKRNEVLKLIFSKVKKGQSVLILLQQLEHLDKTKIYCEENFKDKTIFVISGEIKGDIRQEIREEMNNKGDCILLATFGSFSTGSSISNLHHLVLFQSFNSEVRILQSIGRLLRLHESKITSIIWDIVDNFSHQNNDEDENILKNNKKTKIITNHSMNHFLGKSGWPERTLGRLDYYKEQKWEIYTFNKNILEF